MVNPIIDRMEVVATPLSVERLSSTRVFAYRKLQVERPQEHHCKKSRSFWVQDLRIKGVLVTMKSCTDRIMSMLLMLLYVTLSFWTAYLIYFWISILGTQLPIDRFLAFYYGHPGFHIPGILSDVFETPRARICKSTLATLALHPSRTRWSDD